ncbi:hypothetical protein EVA_19470 [gut metagenome]|uniref:Uncharacterized protein n=1 Tax=gut metagenome TaxID=749906 RepID=J9FDC9_9ZZZZ
MKKQGLQRSFCFPRTFCRSLHLFQQYKDLFFCSVARSFPFLCCGLHVPPL